MKTRKLFLTLLIVLVAAVAAISVACNKEKGDEGPETGAYYCVSDEDQYTLVLHNVDEFTFVTAKRTMSGTYSISEGDIAFTFDSGYDGEAISDAKYATKYITLTYDGLSLKFWKDIRYTVTFDYGEGETQNVTVKNGQKLVAPNDPEKAGNAFLGWFKEDDTPFGFDAEPVTSDFTLHAKWRAIKVGSKEFTIRFDVGEYEGAVDPEAQTTRGGAVTLLEEPQRDGYSFQGWWVSYYDDAEKLAYRLTTDTEITQNMTVYALWTARNVNPMLADVKSDVITWKGVPGVSEYSIEIRLAKDDRLVQTVTNIAETSCNFDWSALDADDYKVVLKGGSESETRYYRNKALDRVSLFEIVGNTLKYNKVANATTYYLSIECGDKNHKHDRLNNGPSTTYNFENCPMDDNGKITFRVIATASGYAESISEAYEFERMLEPIGKKYFVDEENEIVSWNDVPNATGYNVLISCGDDAHEHVYNGTDTFISYKECNTGNITIDITPVSKGYGSPAYTSITIDKKTPATPTGLKVNETELTWNRVPGADSYKVQINALAPKDVSQGESYNFSNDITTLNKGDAIEFRVIAVKSGVDSLPSEALKVNYNKLDENISYFGSTLYWNPIIGASAYIVKVNDAVVSDKITGVNSYRITLTQEGDNTITLGYIDEYGVTSIEEATLTVQASRVILNGDGGNISKTVYKAAGDDMTDLPVPTRVGYKFGGWYNVPGGANSNGTRYDDKIFDGRSVELYADWRPMEYTIDFVISPGDISGEMPKADPVKFGENFTLPVPVNSDPTKVFVAWAFDVTDLTSRVCDCYGDSVRPWNRSDADENGAIKLYPMWETALSFDTEDAYSFTVNQVASGAQKVTSITIPATYKGVPVTTIGDFSGSTIETINIPNTIQLVTTVSGAFDNCRNLKYINVYEVEDKSIPRGPYMSYDGVLVKNDSNTGVVSLEYLPHGTRGRYTIPTGINSIAYSAAKGAEFSELVIPAAVTRIDYSAFASCPNLKSVIFDDQGSNDDLILFAEAFANCPRLKDITLSKRIKLAGIDVEIDGESGNVENIGPAYFSSIFAGCDALDNVSVAYDNQNYRSINGVLFSKDSSTLVFFPHGKRGSYTVPNGTMTIGERAFYGTPRLTSVRLADTVRTIENSAFEACTALRSIYLDRNLITIGERAFYGHFLNNIEMESTVLQTIGAYAFAKANANGDWFFENTSIKGIVLPETVRYIGDYAFVQHKNAFKDLILPNCTYIGDYAFFDGMSIENVILDSVEEIGNAAFSMASLIPEYNEFSVMRTVDLGEKLTSLGSAAFYNCGMKVLRVPSTLKDFGDPSYDNEQLQRYGVFESCGKLYEVENKSEFDLGVSASLYNHKGEEPSKIETLENGLVFYKDDNNVYLVDFVDGSATSVVLPDQYDGRDYTIYANAFANCKSLTAITIGSGVKGIQTGAFSGCDMLYEVFNRSSLTITKSMIPSMKYVYAQGEDSKYDTTEDGFIFGSGNNGYELIGYAGDPESIELPEDYKGEKYSISFDTFANKNLESLTITKGVKAIPNNLFYSGTYGFTNTTLREVVIDVENINIGASAFYNCKSLESVKISGVPSIGASAFYNCSALETVTLEGVQTINNNAFYNCSALLELDLGDDLTSLAMSSLAGCSSLENLTIPGTVTQLGNGNVLNGGMNMPSLKKVVVEEGVKSIGNYAFYQCTALTEVQLPESLTSIGNNAFGGCRSLVEMPAMPNVTSIPNSCFHQCESLTTVTIPEKATSIGNSAFKDCRSLRTVIIGESVASIESSAFSNCTSLKEVYNLSQLDIDVGQEGVAKYAIAVYDDLETRGKFIVDDDGFEFYEGGGKAYLTGYVGNAAALILPYDYNGDTYEIASYAFYHNGNIASVSLSKNVTKIGASAFESGDSTQYPSTIRSLDIPEGKLNAIGERAFAGQKLTKLVIPNSVNVIGPYAFSNNNSLEELVLGSGLTDIQEYAFNNNAALAELIMPNSLRTIGSGAFHHCEALSYVVVGTGLQQIDSEAFAYCTALQTVINLSQLPLVPRSSSYGGIAQYASKINNTDDFISEGNFMFEIIDDEHARLIRYTGTDRNIVFPTIAGNRQYEIPANLFANNISIMSVTIPDCVTAIGAGAFQNCVNVESVEIGSGVRSIGENAFLKCSMLSKLTIKDSDECELTIGNYAFQNCVITELVIPDKVTEIGNFAFDGLRYLKTLVIGDGVQTLGNGAFRNASNLQWIVLGSGLNSIGQSAFTGMTSLEGYFFHGSQTQWTENKLEQYHTGAYLTAGKDLFFYSNENQSGCWHYNEATGIPTLW